MILKKALNAPFISLTLINLGKRMKNWLTATWNALSWHLKSISYLCHESSLFTLPFHVNCFLSFYKWLTTISISFLRGKWVQSQTSHERICDHYSITQPIPRKIVAKIILVLQNSQWFYAIFFYFISDIWW